MNNESLNFDRVDEFKKDFKKLEKKYKTLKDDLENFKQVLKGLLPKHPPGTVLISNLGEHVKIP